MNTTAPGVGDLLSGGSTPIATWDERPPHNIRVGHYYNGKVVKEETSQQTKMLRPGQTVAELEFWDPPTNQRPKWQIILTLQNPAYVTEDNPEGHLRVFLKGGQFIAAQKVARDLGIESFLHGNFQIQWTGTQPAKTPGFNDAKTFEVQFVPGVNPIQSQLLGANPNTGEVPQEQWAAQAPQPPQAPQLVAPQPLQQVQAPPVQQFQAPPPLQQAPAAPQFQASPQLQQQAPQVDGAANIANLMGGVEITPLSPEDDQKVRGLFAAGFTTAPQIVSAFAQYNQTVTEAQVNAVLNTIAI